MKKTVNISFVKGWRTIDGNYKTPIDGHKTVSTQFTKHYHNTIYVLAGLNASCRDLLEFLIQRMDSDNVVVSNTKIREDFIRLISMVTDGDVGYTHNTVKKAFQSLVGKSLLIPRSQRGSYTVNPEFFFRKDEKERVRQIQLLLEDKYWRREYEKETEDNQFK